MTQSPHPDPSGRDRDDVDEAEATSKEAGRTAHGGDQAGPSSDEAGTPIAPQTGDPRDHSH